MDNSTKTQMLLEARRRDLQHEADRHRAGCAAANARTARMPRINVLYRIGDLLIKAGAALKARGTAKPYNLTLADVEVE